MDRLQSMAVFVRVVQAGSFAAAAGALGISPQMVAKHVAFLETRLGTRLLNRTTRRQGLTELGRAYFERCQGILAETEATETMLREARAHPEGRLRVNAPVTFGAACLMPLITRYLALYPDVSVDLSLSDRLVDPVEEGFEAVFRIGPLTEAGMVAHPLAPYRLIACAAPAYLAARGTPQRPEDLAGHECLTFSFWSGAQASQWRFSRAGRAHLAPVSGRLRVNDWRGLQAAALAGQGIALGPELALGEDLAAGRLVRLLPGYEGPARPMHLLLAPDRRPSAKLARFCEMALEAFCAPA